MTVNVDDSTLPLDNSLSSPASEGAGEFRALKAKINALYLNSGIAATIPCLIDTNNKGLNTVISDGSDADLYGSKYTVTRTVSKLRSTFGVYGASILQNNINVGGGGQIAGMGAVVQTGTTCVFGFMFGLSAALYNQTHNNNGTMAGIFITFANRLTAGAAAPSGIGTNWYNKGATGILIDAFPRSSSGEFCGWKTGIMFTANSMDADTTGAGSCIDFSNITYLGGFNPFTAFRMKSVIRMTNFQCIMWDSLNQVCTYFDSNSGRWTLANNGNKRFEIDVVTGQPYANGVAITVP